MSGTTSSSTSSVVLPYYSRRNSAVTTCVYIQSKLNIYDDENNLYLNNSVCIPFTDTCSSLSNNKHSNAAIYLKDSVLSGNESDNVITWHKLQAYDNDLKFNNAIMLNDMNVTDVLTDVYSVASGVFSNIVVTSGVTVLSNVAPVTSYMNFTNSTIQDIGEDGIGLRYDVISNRVQFANNSGEWHTLTSVDSVAIADLNDVNIAGEQRYANQYLRWDESELQWINSNIAVAHDPSPSFSSNISLNAFDVYVNSNLSIRSNSAESAPLLFQVCSPPQLTEQCNYFVMNTSNSGMEPAITVAGPDDDINFEINSKGAQGNIVLNSESNVYINGNSHCTGAVISSIFRTSSKDGGYNPSTNWTIPISSANIMFDFNESSIAGTYWANVAAGIADGQQLSVIFNNSGTSNINVLMDFNSQLYCGYGLCSKLKFVKSGQAASLLYLSAPQNAWQLLNTGASLV